MVGGGVRTDGTLHAGAWLAWAAAAAISIELAPSPVYVAVVIACAGAVAAAHGRGGALGRAFPLLVGLGIGFGLLRVLLTVATTHSQPAAHVLFTTPAFTVPRLLGGFRVGGTVELPVLLQAAAESFTIVGVMAVFGAFNAVVSHYELVASAPRAFYEPGLIVTVAVAFVPATLATVQRVREADRARTGGVTVRRGRMLRLAVPILETGMEQAVALAESMDSRGFARSGSTAADQVAGTLLVVALLGLAGGFVALVGRAPGAAELSVAVGCAALVAAAVVASRPGDRSRYRRRRMTAGERWLLATFLLPPVVLAVLASRADGSLVWEASRMRAPGFNPLAGLALAWLAGPALRPPRVWRAPVPVEDAVT